MKKYLYAAYGSNLNKKQMALRCPSAVPVGLYKLNDYCLEFRGATDNAHLTVSPCVDSAVPIVIWELTETDINALDYYEGWPLYYRKEMMSFTPLFGEGEAKEALIYIMRLGYDFNAPSNLYLQACIEGYKDFNLLINPLKEAFMLSK